MAGMNEIDSPVVQGRPLACLFCGATRFKTYEVRLHITHRSFFHVPVGGLVGTAYVCRACGHSHQFFAPG